MHVDGFDHAKNDSGHSPSSLPPPALGLGLTSDSDGYNKDDASSATTALPPPPSSLMLILVWLICSGV